MSEPLVAIAVAVWLVLAAAAVYACRRERAYDAATHYLEGYIAGVEHERDGLVVVTPPEGVDRATFKRAFGA